MLNVRRENLEAVLQALPALKNPTISTLSDPDWVAINTIVDEDVVRQMIPKLKAAQGAGHRGISAEQDCALMRIHGPERKGSRRRCWRARRTQRRAAPRAWPREIIADVRSRGDAGAFCVDAQTGRRALDAADAADERRRNGRRAAAGSARSCSRR